MESPQCCQPACGQGPGRMDVPWKIKTVETVETVDGLSMFRHTSNIVTCLDILEELQILGSELVGVKLMWRPNPGSQA